MIHERHMEWIEARGLDVALAEKFGLETREENGAAWLVVPYREAGETINHKYRLTSEKRHKMDSGAPLALCNVDILKNPKVQDGSAPLVVTEGEFDMLAVMQAGHPYTVSVPNGAPNRETADLDTAKRYDWFDRHKADLEKVREFVIAADDDEAGHNLRSDLKALFGEDRCKFIEYPKGSKDLNEVLVAEGEKRVVECITTARPFPMKGLYTIDDFPEKGVVRAYSCGVKPIDDLIKIVPGTLTVLTGYANMGKSSLMNCIIGHAMRNHFPVCVASFETDVKPILQDGLLKAMLECGDRDLGNHPDRQMAMQCLRERLTIISQSVDEDLEMDLDEFLKLCRGAVKRGAKMIVLDPWNEVEHKRRRDETETDYIGRAIRALKRFAKQNDVALWVVAHPTKPQDNGKRKPPGLYEISGSANWANKADYGLTYHRPVFEENLAQVIVSKVRMGLPGLRATKEVSFDFKRSEFVGYGDLT